MRHLLVGVALVLAACGGSSDSTAPASADGRLVFKLDPATCTMYAASPVNVALFVSRVSVDTLDMTAGDTASFTEPYGLHLVSANETVSKGVDFGSALVTVPAGGSYTWLMKCQTGGATPG